MEGVLVLKINKRLSKKIASKDFLTLPSGTIVMGIHIPTFLEKYGFSENLTLQRAKEIIRKSTLSKIFVIKNITRETLTFLY